MKHQVGVLRNDWVSFCVDPLPPRAVAAGLGVAWQRRCKARLSLCEPCTQGTFLVPVRFFSGVNQGGGRVRSYL